MGLWLQEGEVRGWGQMEVGDGGGGSRPSSSRGLRVREHSGDMKGPTPKGTLVLRSGDLQSHSPSPTWNTWRAALPNPDPVPISLCPDISAVVTCKGKANPVSRVLICAKGIVSHKTSLRADDAIIIKF